MKKFLFLILVSVATMGADSITRLNLLSEINSSKTDYQPIKSDKYILSKRVRYVDINTSALLFLQQDSIQQQKSIVLVLDLFKDLQLEVYIKKIKKSTLSNTIIIQGHITGDPYSHVSIAVTDGIISGSIRDGKGNFYKINYSKDSVYVEEVDESKYPERSDPLIPESKNYDNDISNESVSQSADVSDTFDIMVLYTASAKNAAGGKAAIESIIQSSVATMNTTFENSNISSRVQLVYMQEVSYNRGETGLSSGFNTALYDLTDKTDGYMDDIHQLRDNYHADMVQLLFNNNSLGGLAWVMQTPSSSFESNAFSVVHYSYSDGWAFDHEFGHNMGMAHDRAHAGISGSYSYSYGYQSPTNTWHSVMSYNCPTWCPRIDYWSNPNVSYNGEAIGIPIGQTNEADGKISITNNAGIIANWRQRPNSPDLVVQSPSVSDDTLEEEQSFTASAIVQNVGKSSSVSTILRYYISSDSTITTSDTFLGNSSVPALSAGGTSSQSVILTTPNTPGTYYIGSCVESVTNESSTMNNCSSGVVVTITTPPVTAPDLIVQNPLVSDSILEEGQSFTAYGTVKNQGTASSTSSTLRYYISSDSTITTSDTFLGNSSVPALSAGGTSSQSVILTTPNTPGTYYIGSCVESVTNESSTMNNCSSGVVVTITTPPVTAPDLIVQNPLVSDSILEEGQSFTAYGTVKNQGTASSTSSTLRYYISSDSTITTSDTFLGNSSVPALSAGGTSSQSVILTTPNTPGTYYIGSCVESVTNESSTMNNCSSGVVVTITTPPVTAPDLIVQNPLVSDSILEEGQSFTAYGTVKNQGTASSTSSTLRYYISSDSTITTSDTFLGNSSVPALSAGGTSSQSVILTTPNTPGTYYIGSCVESVTNESSTMNNCSSGVVVTIDSVETLASSVPIFGSVTQYAFKYYKISAKKGQSLSSLLDQMNADIDLYVKIGSKPILSSYDCASLNGSTMEEKCSIPLTENADVYIGVYGYQTGSYRLTATIDGIAGKSNIVPIIMYLLQ